MYKLHYTLFVVDSILANNYITTFLSAEGDNECTLITASK